MTSEEKSHILLFGLGACIVMAYGWWVHSWGVVFIGMGMGLLYGAADCEGVDK